MSYLKKVLLPGEIIVYQTGLHWLIYLRATFFLILALAIFGVSLQIDQQYAIFVQGVAAICLLVAIIDGLGAAVQRASTELAVTDQRVIYKRGILSRHTLEMNRSKVESVDVDQSLVGRMFGYGTVLLRGTGGSLEPFRSISDPLTFRSHITAEPLSHAPPG